MTKFILGAVLRIGFLDPDPQKCPDSKYLQKTAKKTFALKPQTVEKESALKIPYLSNVYQVTAKKISQKKRKTNSEILH